MVVQDSGFEGVSENVSFFEIIYRPVGILVYSVVIDSFKSPRPVLTQELFPAGELPVSSPVLAAEAGLLVGCDVFRKGCLLRMGNASFKSEIRIRGDPPLMLRVPRILRLLNCPGVEPPLTLRPGIAPWSTAPALVRGRSPRTWSMLT